MNKADLLARRRELLVLSAKLQRVNIETRLDRFQAHPTQAIFGFVLRESLERLPRTRLLPGFVCALIAAGRHVVGRAD